MYRRVVRGGTLRPVDEVRADLERAGGDASVLCGFGRCFCVKTAVGARLRLSTFMSACTAWMLR